ncbi:MAG TPA: DHA2 family efflux MFS transporter permease subunit [Gaiellaceae bacterium]|nr:DHA2 family efflux MFS transporter permease subunit [Gaiellaceae bacterium]
MTHKQKRSMIWTLVITSAALFMVSLDNLVVSTALPVIRHDLHATISQLEWTVNAYTLTFAVLLLTGAALGDRFGRRRLFVFGILLFTAASAGAALATTANQLDIARAVQGVGGAIVAPLTLTILSAGVPAARRGLALGIWGGIGGLAIAIGPLVGGAVVSGFSWNWIFWLNVPIGLVLAPLAYARLDETYGSDSALDLRGLTLVSSGLLGIVWGLVRGNAHGWTSLGIVAPIVAGVVLVGAFIWWESRATSPMLPLAFFRNRTFALSNVASLFMFFGMFGSIFFLAQFFQTVQGYTPLQSGLRILPWTAMPIFVAPIAGALSDRIGGQRLMAAGLALQAAGLAWIAAISTPTMPYTHIIGAFVISGVGMALFFAPVANVVLSSVRPDQEGKASGANNAIREVGGVFGVAVLATIFSRVGGYQSAESFVHGMTTAVYVGAGLVALGALAAALIPPRRVREGVGAAEALQVAA